MQHCAACGKALVGGRSDRRYCDARCRRRAQRARDRDARGIVGEVLARFSRRDAAQVEDNLLAYVMRAAESDWRAATWLLGKIAPERYGRAIPAHVVPAAPAKRNGDDPFAEVDELRRRRERQRDLGR